MNATTAAIDLAKNVFQVALADSKGRVFEQHRLTRAQFERFFDNRSVSRMIMEACGSAHHWARVFGARGIEVSLLPAMYVRAYVRRSKTDAADALALLEAARCADIVAVKVKSVEQQSLQALHRTRSLWMGTRTSRINALRGFCRELGLHVPVCRVASRNFVTGCLTKDVTRYLTDEALNGLLPPHPHSLLQRMKLSQAVPPRVTRLELDQQFKCGLIRVLLKTLHHLFPMVLEGVGTSSPRLVAKPSIGFRADDDAVHASSLSS